MIRGIDRLMNVEGQDLEYTAEVEGPAPFLDAVFEVIEAHVTRTGHAYTEVISGVEAEDAGDVEHENNAVLLLYILPEIDREEARDYIDLALDRIAEDQNMSTARGLVRVQFLDDEEYEDEG